MDSHILAIGGHEYKNHEHFLDSVDIYNIEMDTWERAPPLSQARDEHSSCSLGDYAYVIGGCNSNCNSIIAFERLNVARLTRGEQSVAWEPLNIATNQGMSPRFWVSMTALDANQLLIFGGASRNDGYIVDVREPITLQ